MAKADSQGHRRRHVMGRGRRAVVVVAALGSFLAVSFAGTALAQSSSSSASSAAPSGPGAPVTFVEGTINDIETINPFNALSTPEYEVLSLNFDMLENFDKNNLSAAPGLATSWTTSSDGLTWTYTIRSDAKWHDGQPLTAKDIAFTYNTTLQCQLGNGLDYLVPDLTKSITAPNDTTLVWTVKEPTTAPIRPPWLYIVPQHIWGNKTCKEITDSSFLTDGKMIGSGPFELTQWVKGESWTMTANPDYWGGAPHIDQFVVKKYNNNEAMVTALKTGAIDYIGNDSSTPPDLFNQLQAENGANGITTNVGPLLSFDQMSFNMCDPAASDAAPYCKSTGSTGNPALLDPDFRKAVLMAIDTQTIIDKVQGGYAQAGTTIVPPAFQFHTDPASPVSFDIAAANQLLDQAGYTDTDGNGLRNAKGGGDDIDLRFILRSQSTIEPQLGKYISGFLRQVGIGTKTEVLTDSKLETAWYANDYDLYIWGWSPDPDPDFILSTFTSGQCGSWSDTCYSNPKYDDLYKQQRTAGSPEERASIISQMQDIIYQDSPEIVLDYYNTLEAYNSTKWTGLQDNMSPQPGAGLLFGQYTPYSALTLAPRTGTSTTSSNGIPAIAWVGIIAVVGVVIAGVIGISRRRSASDEDLA